MLWMLKISVLVELGVFDPLPTCSTPRSGGIRFLSSAARDADNPCVCTGCESGPAGHRVVIFLFSLVRRRGGVQPRHARNSVEPSAWCDGLTGEVRNPVRIQPDLVDIPFDLPFVVPFVDGGLAWCWLPYHPLLLRFLTIWGPGVTKGRHRKGIRRPFL
jgi:hypothetical protein